MNQPNPLNQYLIKVIEQSCQFLNQKYYGPKSTLMQAREIVCSLHSEISDCDSEIRGTKRYFLDIESAIEKMDKMKRKLNNLKAELNNFVEKEMWHRTPAYPNRPELSATIQKGFDIIFGEIEGLQKHYQEELHCRKEEDRRNPAFALFDETMLTGKRGGRLNERVYGKLLCGLTQIVSYPYGKINWGGILFILKATKIISGKLGEQIQNATLDGDNKKIKEALKQRYKRWNKYGEHYEPELIRNLENTEKEFEDAGKMLLEELTKQDGDVGIK